MQEIGTIQFVQVQQASLKDTSPDGTKAYNPESLIRLPQIKLTTTGIIGFTESGDMIIDVHNLNHPQSRHRGDNPISIGFTTHYEKMREEMGSHLTDGIAGESIIVASDQIYTPDTIGKRLVIKSNATGQLIYLNEVIPIPPCAPFSRFAQARPLSPSETKSTLQFLSEGTRGFYAKLESSSEGLLVQAGDYLYRVSD